MSPVASFWDCGEFILASNELQVGHPPGASLYLLIGRLFAMTAGSNVENIAYMINLMSVLVSAFTVLFIFWTVTLLGRKMLIKGQNEPTLEQMILIMVAGATGALACCFSDSFWFNAVEAEVYAMSSLFTAVVIWLMFKWELRADQPHNLKYLVLIAYIMGLSIGVHLLNLLAIPALAFIYYFRKYKFSWLGVLGTLGVSVVILAFIQYGVIQITMDLAWWFERLFVGTIAGEKETGFGMPFGSGGIIFFLLLIGVISGLIWYSQKKGMVLLNTVILCIAVVYIGFSSYSIIIIRSVVNPPIDQNDPEHLGNFVGYVKREQYGDRPLFKGPQYNNSPFQYEDKGNAYMKYEGKTRYTDEGPKQVPEYRESDKVFFPRMYSDQHYTTERFGYMNYVKNKGADEADPLDDKPSSAENIKFLFDYQIKHMYLRYFMWNFAGRENDIPDAEWVAFPDKSIPEDIKKDYPGSYYFFLPLLLGLLGLFWHFQQDRRDAFVVTLLFLFTGLAIIFYLNQTPAQPRERDYSYVGSFQTFCMWIGIGVIALYDMLKKYLKSSAVYVASGLSLLAAPVLMAAQNWHSHDRSQNYISVETAYNFLNSCAKNAILFTFGDNDTFPLWYLQEVEGVRPDIRIVNLSYLNTDWYVFQNKHFKVNDADPLPLSITEDMYMGDKNAIIPFKTTTIDIPVDKAAVIASGLVRAEDTALIQSPLKWLVEAKGGRYLERKDLVIIDLILSNARSGWKRPIYFATTAASSAFLNLTDFFQQEGLAYRVVPISNQAAGLAQGYTGRIDREIMSDNMLKVWKYKGFDSNEAHIDYDSRRMINNFRTNFYRLSTEYLDYADNVARDSSLTASQREEKIKSSKDKAKEIMDFCIKNLGGESVPFEAYNLALTAKVYQRLSDTTKARELFTRAMDKGESALKYIKPRQNDAQTGEINSYAIRLAMQYGYETKDYVVAERAAKILGEYENNPEYINTINALKQQASPAVPKDS